MTNMQSQLVDVATVRGVFPIGLDMSINTVPKSFHPKRTKKRSENKIIEWAVH